MKETIVKYKRRIFAEDENFTLEQRIMVSTTILGMLTGLMGGIVNLFLVTSILATLMPFVLVLSLLTLYYFFRYKKIFRPFVLPMVFLAYISISIIFLSNGGLDGANILPALVILMLTIISVDKKLKLVLTLLFIFVFIVNYSIDFYYPEIITRFPSEKERWIDALITIVYTSLFIYFIIIYILNQYNSEKAKAEASETELKELNIELANLNNSKDKFFSIIAHDIKSPLGIFKNISSMLEESYDDLDDAEKKDFLSLMNSSARNLNSLLENLLDWSQIQQGVFVYEESELDLSQIAKSTINDMKLNAQAKSIKIFNKIPASTIVKADPNMLSSIFRNLLSNAIKFTQQNGNVVVDAKKENNFYIISIKDSGVGIDKSTIEKLFKIENKSSTLGTNAEKGTGLGLILCKEFVAQHGGKIWVESTKSIGSTFYFTIENGKYVK